MIEAGFSGPCPGCEGTIHEGEPVGTVDGVLCCGECVDSCGEDDDLLAPTYGDHMRHNHA